MKTSYIAQINMFHDWCDIHHPSLAAKQLWHELMHWDNKSGWEEWFSVSTNQLIGCMDINRNAIAKHRSELISLGLVEYRSGKKGKPAQYKINFFVMKNGVPVPVGDTSIRDSAAVKNNPPAQEPHTGGYTQTEREANTDENESQIVQSNVAESSAETDSQPPIVQSKMAETDAESKKTPPIMQSIMPQNVAQYDAQNAIMPQNMAEFDAQSKIAPPIVPPIMPSIVPPIVQSKMAEYDSLLCNIYKTQTQTQTCMCVEDPKNKKGEKKKKATHTQDRIDYTKVMEFWNEHRNRMPSIKLMTDDRKRKVRSIVDKFSKEDLMTAILKAEASNYMNGGNNRDWRASFDWIIKPGNFVKILEGNYDNRDPKPLGSGTPSATQDRITAVEKIEDDFYSIYADEIAELESQGEGKD